MHTETATVTIEDTDWADSFKSSEIDILKERIKQLEQPRYQSGYLRSKFG